MEPEASLLAEQLRRTIDNMRSELDAVKAGAAHDRELMLHRIKELEGARNDHETRIRSLQDGATTFRVWSGLASGGSSVISLAAFLKVMFGG
jgi:hypothetical protein